MACLHIEPRDTGYATPLAMAVCLALTLGVGALTATSASELRLARRDLARMQAEQALSGVQAEAAVRLIESGAPGSARWTLASPVGAAEVLAEPEAPKLSHAAAAKNGRLMTLLGAPAGLATQVDQAADRLADLAAGGAWPRCARSFISPYGAAERLALATPGAPDLSGPSWRAGQVWRFRVSAGGWVDDRVVRFTGAARAPVAVVEREFGRGESLGTQCDEIFKAAAVD